MRILIRIFFAFVLIIIGAAYYFAHVLMFPAKYECQVEHFAFCGTPDSVGLSYEDVEFATADRFTIKGWYVPGNPAAPSVLLVHGRGVDRHEGLRFGPALHAAGFNLLLIDLRNAGESQKSFISMGYYERRDVLAAVDYLALVKSARSIGVFGFSMGATTSILSMSVDQRIRAGIFEGGFSDFRSIIADTARNDYFLPEYPLVPIVEWIFEMRGNLSASEIVPVKRIASISPRPIFIIHGTADRRVPPDHGARLFAAAGQPKWFWSVPGGRHTRAWQADRPKAEAMVTEFFLKYL
ncbi:MAG: prolyl oligopeptidase family serine peptidase [Spirochaetia bacterium]|nr:prolyl oligopeptidase family serine peptidase [Spirochaetia bacterium]